MTILIISEFSEEEWLLITWGPFRDMQTIQNRSELSNAYLHHVLSSYRPVLSRLQQVSLLAKVCILWFPGTEKYSSFPSPQKLTFPNFNSARNDVLPLNHYLFIRLFIISYPHNTRDLSGFSLLKIRYVKEMKNRTENYMFLTNLPILGLFGVTAALKCDYGIYKELETFGYEIFFTKWIC